MYVYILYEDVYLVYYTTIVIDVCSYSWHCIYIHVYIHTPYLVIKYKKKRQLDKGKEKDGFLCL